MSLDQKRSIVVGLFIGTTMFYLLTTNLAGSMLIRSLERNVTIQSDHSANDVIVMLGGGATSDTPDLDGRGNLSGNAANRLLTTARLYFQTELPIIVSGGQVYNNSGNEAEIAKRLLTSLNVPEEKIIIENKSLNTDQNAECFNFNQLAPSFDGLYYTGLALKEYLGILALKVSDYF